jgi:dolichol-phosphate mannosyltransferase
MKAVRYILSGAIATATDLALLYMFTEFLGWWYLWSVIVAFILANIVSFLLQKYWTFEERSTADAPRQFTRYLIISITNSGINTGIVYVLVTTLATPYLIAQVIAAAILALTSFFIYRRFVFYRKNPIPTIAPVNTP